MININLNIDNTEYPITIERDDLILALLNNGNGKTVELIRELIIELLKEKDNVILTMKLKELKQLLENNL
jgi:siroheme synthase (precorrin-2 oxidase/ferrochelatase)